MDYEIGQKIMLTAAALDARYLRTRLNSLAPHVITDGPFFTGRHTVGGVNVAGENGYKCAFIHNEEIACIVQEEKQPSDDVLKLLNIINDPDTSESDHYIATNALGMLGWGIMPTKPTSWKLKHIERKGK